MPTPCTSCLWPFDQRARFQCPLHTDMPGFCRCHAQDYAIAFADALWTGSASCVAHTLNFTLSLRLPRASTARRTSLLVYRCGASAFLSIGNRLLDSQQHQDPAALAERRRICINAPAGPEPSGSSGVQPQPYPSCSSLAKPF